MKFEDECNYFSPMKLDNVSLEKLEPSRDI